jgi:hypothetical protein
MSDTVEEYNRIVAKCKDIFTKKTADYGTAWRVMRVPGITDQIYIKAKRIKTLEQKGESKVGEGIIPEYMAMINYCIMGLIQLERGFADDADMLADEAVALYTKHFEETRDLMLKKNHDYGEAWREMRVESFTDLILMKLLRIKQIEDNGGKTLVSEGIDANYHDIINYSVFALIQSGEAN